jgi:hypothetical protein
MMALSVPWSIRRTRAAAVSRLRKPSPLQTAALALVVALVVSVTRFQAPNFTLEPSYTDHLQHEYSSWAFLHIGFRIFNTPLGDWGNVHAAHPHLFWTQLPTIYPPGLVLFFLPFGVASNEGLLADSRVHELMVMLLGVAALFAAFQLRRTLKLSYEPVLAAVLTILGSILFLTWGLDGFIDPLAAGLALAGIYWIRQDLPGRGIVLLALGLSLQYRLWYLWPLVLVVAVRRWRAIERWQLALTCFIATISTVTFAMSVSFVTRFHDISGIQPNALAVTHGVNTEQGIALVAGAIVVAIAFLNEPPEVAACVLLGFLLIFFVDQWEAWYPVLFVPLLAVIQSRLAQIAVTLVFLEGLFYLGGFPNLMRSVHLYIHAIA